MYLDTADKSYKIDCFLRNQPPKELFKAGLGGIFPRPSYNDLLFARERSLNWPVSYSNGWTGSIMKWRLMRAN